MIHNSDLYLAILQDLLRTLSILTLDRESQNSISIRKVREDIAILIGFWYNSDLYLAILEDLHRALSSLTLDRESQNSINIRKVMGILLFL